MKLIIGDRVTTDGRVLLEWRQREGVVVDVYVDFEESLVALFATATRGAELVWFFNENLSGPK